MKHNIFMAFYNRQQEQQKLFGRNFETTDQGKMYTPEDVMRQLKW